MRLASSPTLISSGIWTVTGVFLMTSSRRRRSRSASSCLLLLLWGPPRRPDLLRIFSLPWVWRWSRRVLPLRASAISWSFSSYLSRFTAVAFRVSTTLVWGTRLTGFFSGWGCCACWPGFFSASAFLAAGCCLAGSAFFSAGLAASA